MIRQGASGKDAELEINLFDAVTGAAITGHAFIAGEVLISLPNATAALEVFGNAAHANIIEKGRGRYALRLTALETATAGLVQLDLDTANGYMPHSITERIGPVDAAVVSLGTSVIDLDTFVPRCLRILSQKLVPGYLTLDIGQPITRTSFRVDAGLGVDFLVNVLVTVTDGTGLGWFAICETYNTATGDATFYGSGFAGVIDATSVLSIYPSTVQAPLSKLPAALVGGRMDSNIGDVSAFGSYQIQGAVALATVIPTAATSNTISFQYNGPLGDDVITDLDPDTLVGMTITLHNPNLTRDEAPQTRRISAGAYDGGTNTYTATVTPAWSPVPVGTFGDDGGDYVARLWPASTGLATTQDAADILSEVQGVGADLGAVASDIIDLQADMDTALDNLGAILGLLHHNSVIDKQIWSGKDLTSCRVRQFASAAAAGAATPGALDNADGEIRRFLIAVTYSATGKPSRYMITEVL